jgi:hypothetical protein
VTSPPPAPTRTLLLEAVDGLGLDVDRLRADAGKEKFYFTGLEFAVVVGMPMVIDFFQAVVQGVIKRAGKGETTTELGEELGERSADAIIERIKGVAGEARRYKDAPEHDKAGQERLIASLDAVMADGLADLRGAATEEDVSQAGAEIAIYLAEEGLPADRAKVLGPRIAGRIFDEWRA